MIMLVSLVAPLCILYANAAFSRSRSHLFTPQCWAAKRQPVGTLGSAVDRYALAGHIAGPRPDEEGDHASDVLRPAYAAERGRGVERRQLSHPVDGAGHAASHLRVYESRRHDRSE